MSSTLNTQWKNAVELYATIATLLACIPPDDVLAWLCGLTTPRISQARGELKEQGWDFATLSPKFFLNRGAVDRGELANCQFWIVTQRPAVGLQVTDGDRAMIKDMIFDRLCSDSPPSDHELLAMLRLAKGEQDNDSP